jgi:hypothetical protein
LVRMENRYHLEKAVLLLVRMENPYRVKAVHPLDQMENRYHLEKVVPVTLDLADLAVRLISVDLADHRLNKKKLQETRLRQL